MGGNYSSFQRYNLKEFPFVFCYCDWLLVCINYNYMIYFGHIVIKFIRMLKGLTAKLFKFKETFLFTRFNGN